METFVLLDITGTDTRVIRTYESRERATEDLELVKAISPEKTFCLITAQHIDR